MGQIIACGNLKGGTGKSTIAINVACALAGRGHTVIVLDVDPQGTSSRWTRRGLLPVWAEAAPPVDLHGRGRWQSRAIELAGTFDLVVLDLPPLVGPALAGASMISDLVLVPITPSGVDVQPTAEALRILRRARESRGGHKPKGLLVPNKVDDRGHYDEATQQAFDNLPERWSPPISQDTAHVNAFAAGAWVGSYAPGAGAAEEIEALMEVVEALLGDLATMASAGAPRDRAPAPQAPIPA